MIGKIRTDQSGFTIVELLIVIVVIAILAVIVIGAYSGLQERARNAQISANLSEIEKAISAARINENSALFAITGHSWTAESCATAPGSIDLTNTANPAVAACWDDYNHFLDTVSNASGVDIRDIVDPWGRPYYIDENEDEYGNGSCNRDVIAVYLYPHVSYSFDMSREVANSLPGC